MLIGYSPDSKAYHLFHWKTGKVITSYHMSFIESHQDTNPPHWLGPFCLPAICLHCPNPYNSYHNHAPQTLLIEPCPQAITQGLWDQWPWSPLFGQLCQAGWQHCCWPTNLAWMWAGWCWWCRQPTPWLHPGWGWLQPALSQQPNILLGGYELPICQWVVSSSAGRVWVFVMHGGI